MTIGEFDKNGKEFRDLDEHGKAGEPINFIPKKSLTYLQCPFGRNMKNKFFNPNLVGVNLRGFFI